MGEDETSQTGQSRIFYEDEMDIRLSAQDDSLQNIIALDIGGSLIKLAYFSPSEPGPEPIGGAIHFTNFEADSINQCYETIQQLIEDRQYSDSSTQSDFRIIATGGGAYKHYDDIQKVLGVAVVREDEMESLILGLDFLVTKVLQEVFAYTESGPRHFIEPSTNIYPYLLVNIGSGVSMIKVSEKGQFRRVGGTSLGGGTFWGLLSLLTGASSFPEMLDMAEKGDNATVDLLVGDIYGTDYGKIGLKSTTIASSFGKVFKMKREAESHTEQFGMSDKIGTTIDGELQSTRSFGPEDISRSLLLAVSNNIGQIAYLQSEKHQLERIYFAGSFIQGYHQTMKTLSNAIKFWSEGKKQAYFLRHEGYLGSLGAFIKQQSKA